MEEIEEYLKEFCYKNAEVCIYVNVINFISKFCLLVLSHLHYTFWNKQSITMILPKTFFIIIKIFVQNTDLDVCLHFRLAIVWSLPASENSRKKLPIT